MISKVTTGENSLGYPNHEPSQELVKRAKRVHCLLGFALDMVTMGDVLSEISEAARTRQRLFLSTVNLNFVALAQTDQDFRNSLRSSNLCLADGIAVQLIGRFLGMPIPERVAGSDILNAIWTTPSNPQDPPLKVFFFGGTEAVNQLACDAVNRHPSRKIVCVGNLYPGFGTVEEMSSNAILETINRANPDFLIVALGARKGQAWIMRNKEKLNAPVISHLGATINFLAGTVKRAPVAWQKLGLEWLWRIKEEPGLAKRYVSDGLNLIGLLMTCLLPLSIWLRWCRWRRADEGFSTVPATSTENTFLWSLEGAFTEHYVAKFINTISTVSLRHSVVELDLARLSWIDTAAMGSLLVLSERLRDIGGQLKFVNLQPSVLWTLRKNGLGNHFDLN